MTENKELAKVVLEEIETKPKGIVLLPGRGELLITTGRGNSVVVMNSDSLERLATIPVGKRVWGIAATPDEKLAFTADGVDNAVSVVDIEQRKVVKTIPVGERPWGVVYDPGS